MEQYQEMYDRSISDPEGFWGEIAEQFVWKEKWSKVLDYTFEGNVDDQVVHRRQDQPLRQLPGPPPRDARRPDGHHLGRQRPRAKIPS